MHAIDRAIEANGLSNAVVFIADGWRARLIARLSAIGARPFTAHKIVEYYDACRIQQLLDAAERSSGSVAERSRTVFTALDRAPRAVAVPGMAIADQLSFEPGRPLAPECTAELATAVSNGADYVRYLPRNAVDRDGRLAGDVVYARDFGARNALLRARFADRAWYRASVTRVDGRLQARLEPIPH